MTSFLDSIPHDRIAEFCRRWDIVEFSLFGSALGEEFRPDSDVDILVRFEPGTHPGIDEYIEMTAELRGLFARDVDLVNLAAVANPYLRHEILSTRRVIHAA